MYDTTIIDELMIKGPLWRLYKFYGRIWMDIKIWWPTNRGVEIRLVFLVWGSNPFWRNDWSWKKESKLLPIGTRFQNTKEINQKVGVLAKTAKWEGFHGYSWEGIPLFIPKVCGSNYLNYTYLGDASEQYGIQELYYIVQRLTGIQLLAHICARILS